MNTPCPKPGSAIAAPRFYVLCALFSVLFLSAADATEATGITEPFRQETVSASVPGTVTRLAVREGDQVKAKQVVVELDRRREELEVARRKLVWESRVELEAAIARVAVLKADLDSTRKVYEATKSISKEDLENKVLEHRLAIADQQRLELAEERERLEYELAEEALTRRTLKCSMDGVVTARHIEEGENCEPRQPLLEIVDLNRCYFVANIPSEEAVGLVLGQPVRLEIGGGPKTISCVGEMAYISPLVDPASGLQEVKAVFTNPERRVRPGVTGTMLVETPKP